MQLDTDEWTTGSEAARLLGCSPQRVSEMAEEGSLDVVRPWPRVSLIGRRSVAEWLAGARPTRINVADARRWIMKRNSVTDVRIMDVDEVRDQLRDYFIADARPRWDRQRMDLWALEMAERVMQGRPYATTERNHR